MFVLYGLLTAISFGVGDFFAGLAARRAAALTVVLYSQSIGAGVITLAAIALGGRPSLPELAWGSVAGIALGLGYILYYHALGRGKMGLIAAVAGIWTALAPFIVGLALGERPSLAALLGALLVVLAIGLVSGGDPHKQAKNAEPAGFHAATPGVSGQGSVVFYRRGVTQAALAGTLFGLFFAFLDQAQAGSPLWPAAAATVVSAAVVVGLIPALRPNLRTSLPALGVIAIAGLCQALGTLAFVIAVRQGLLSIAAVAGALSPIPTAVCAFVFLHERPTGWQLIGIAGALLGIVLMILG